MITPDILKQQVLMEGIDEAGLTRIAGITHKVSIKKGEQLFKEKDETKGLWLIHAGKIEISRITADGWRQTLVVLPAGHFFGELSILENRKHVASATALEDSELLLIPKEEFENLVQQDCALALKLVMKLMIVMSKNLRRMNDKFLSALISY
jgi:CRP/FNR family transcriptional regulator